MTTFLINFCAIAAIVSGVFVVTSKNPVMSVLFLIAVFVSVAAFLVFHGTTYLGLAYIIIYVGAIAILFLFVIMMLNISSHDLWTSGKEFAQNYPLGTALAVLLTWEILSLQPSSASWSNVETYASFLTASVTALFLIISSLFNAINLAAADAIEFVHAVAEYLLLSGVQSFPDIALSPLLQIQSIGINLYTNLFMWLFVASCILMLAMVGPIILCMEPSKMADINQEPVQSLDEQLNAYLFAIAGNGSDSRYPRNPNEVQAGLEVETEAEIAEAVEVQAEVEAEVEAEIEATDAPMGVCVETQNNDSVVATSVTAEPVITDPEPIVESVNEEDDPEERIFSYDLVDETLVSFGVDPALLPKMHPFDLEKQPVVTWADKIRSLGFIAHDGYFSILGAEYLLPAWEGATMLDMWNYYTNLDDLFEYYLKARGQDINLLQANDRKHFEWLKIEFIKNPTHLMLELHYNALERKDPDMYPEDWEALGMPQGVDYDIYTNEIYQGLLKMARLNNVVLPLVAIYPDDKRVCVFDYGDLNNVALKMRVEQWVLQLGRPFHNPSADNGSDS